MAGASVKRRVDGATHKIDTAVSPAGLGSCFAVSIVVEGGWPQSLADSMAAHLRTLKLLGGASELDARLRHEPERLSQFNNRAFRQAAHTRR